VIKREMGDARIASFVALSALGGLIDASSCAGGRVPGTTADRSRSHAMGRNVNKGDVDAFARTCTPETIRIDAFGRTMGVNAEFL